MLYVFALSGASTSGKSTAADLLVENLKKNIINVNVIRIGFADKVKEVAKELFNWDGDKGMYYPKTGDTSSPIQNKGRQLLINVATLLKEIDLDVWAKYAIKRVYQEISELGAVEAENFPTVVVIDDLRFESEVEILDKYFKNLILVRIEKKVDRIDDESENDLDDFDEWDAIIDNNFDKQTLDGSIKVLINEFIKV